MISGRLSSEKWLTILGLVCVGGIAGPTLYKTIRESMPKPPEWTPESAIYGAARTVSDSLEMAKRQKISA